MDKVYNHKDVEQRVYDSWITGGYFSPKIDPTKKPFSIILPLPNANDPMHMGHALFTVQDIMIRYHRMLGEPTLWLPGGDHAGIETQFVFEKKLSKEGKSRFDFDRDTLYKMIAGFVEGNKDLNKEQMKLLGFSLDWSRYHYSLEPEIVERVLGTFRKLHNDGLLYRAQRLVNYCTKCGTAFSDLEVEHKEKDDQLYYLDYGAITIATARPETIFADAAVAVNPKDIRYKDIKILSEKAVIPLINKEIPIITDEEIQIDFGTGALKVTPAHDKVDYEIGQRHKLPVIETISTAGRMINVPEKYLGMKVLKAREAVVANLQAEGKLKKTEPLHHSVATCYRCNSTIEPMLIPQWYIKTKPLAEPAIRAVKEGQTKILPTKRFEKLYFDWMEKIEDWNISRQIVWGPRIPVYYCLDCNPSIMINFITRAGEKASGFYADLKNRSSFEEIEKGLQSLSAPLSAVYSLNSADICEKCGGNHILQETDTFDTWFLSSQWPVNTLKSKPGDFEYFYPTSVLDTMWDILFFWVGRMMMMGLYLTGNVPFKIVHIHPRVVDKFGKKMSKSKGNVMNPIEMSDKYGADALRFALVYGTAPASDIAMSEEKVRGMRNFTNKIWNSARYILTSEMESRTINPELRIDKKPDTQNNDDKKILEDLEKVIKEVTENIKSYHFGQAAEIIYEFYWHEFCDVYIEQTKARKDEAQPVLLYILSQSLRLLHPFMPFITEELWEKMPKSIQEPLIISGWP